jgi:hypothetical protein
MPKAKRYVIGIGSQRAGSTLLHEIIGGCTSIYMHPLKELHYFDTWHGLRGASVLKDFSRQQLSREIDQICAADNFAFVNWRFKNYLRANFLLLSKSVEEIEYADLFQPNLRRHDTLGEITPEYMELPPAGVAHMAEVVGTDARIILIARNPVKRLLSSFKLMNVYNNIQLSEAEANVKLASLIDSEGVWLQEQDRLNAYEAAMKNFRACFPNVLMLRYDDFVDNPERLRTRLSEFLEERVDAGKLHALLAKRPNDIGKGHAFSEAALQRLEARYRPVSEFLTASFGSACLL